jgi:PAS domain S-box-containing protein
MDSSHRSRAEKRLAREIERAMLLLELYEQASVLSEHELFRFALQKTLDLTESRIGFLHLISEDQRKVILTAWSAEVSKQCTTIHATHYPIEEAGLWVDCVHHGRPMIFNDYLRTPHRKGLPPGHAAVNRFMSVPVIIKGKARIVFGVGNKVGPYDQHDVVQLQLVANELGKFLEARRTESALLQSQASFRLLVERAPVAVAIIHRDDRSLRYLNPAALELLGFQAEDIPELESFLQRAVTKEADAEAIRAWDESSPLRISDLHLRCLDGATRIVDLTLVANDELIFLFASDLSARVCAQLALREQLAFEEYIRGLLARLSTTPAELMSLQLHTEVRALVSFLAARACQLIPAQTLERVFQTIAWPSKSQFSPRLPPADLDDIIERAPQQMLAPLRSSGNLLGYLELHLCQRPTTHTPSKQQLAMLADAFATALDKLRAESVVRQQHAELALLNRIMFMATLHQDPRTVFDYACRELKNGFEVEHIAILDTATTKAENDGQRFQVPIPNKSGEAKSLTIDPLQEPLSNEQVSLLNSVAHILATVIDRAWANETQRRLLTAIEQTPESIVITDRNANIQYVNPAFERITGYRSEEVRGRNPRLLSAGDTEPAHFEGMWETISQGQVWHGRFTNRTKEGLIFVEDAVIAPVYDDEQQLVSYIGIKRDITQELEIEAQFRHAQKFEAVGQLAGSVAHDFNNHLAAILLQLHSLHSEEALSEDAAQTVQDLINTVRRASTLTRQLLLFSRRQALTATQQDLNSVVEEFVRTLGRLFGEHIELVFSPAPQSLPFIGDVGMLEQVLMNLCVNARDAMPQGGRLNIHTSMELPCVEFEPPAGRIGKRSGRLGEQRPHVVLSVLDEGTGLDAAQLEQLFEPFFTTKPINQGTGLGLATVAAIVAQHHGWLEVDTAPAQGSRFRVFLPSRICRDSQPSLPPIPPKQRGKEGILLVEDDPVIRDATRVCLQRWGYRVFSAANGVKALELWAQHLSSIDLLLSDMVMPEGLSGLDLSIRMRREKPTLGVIITSGYSVDMAKLGLSPEHDLVFIPKPYDPNLLAQAIRNCLNAHRAPNS